MPGRREKLEHDDTNLLLPNQRAIIKPKKRRSKCCIACIWISSILGGLAAIVLLMYIGHLIFEIIINKRGDNGKTISGVSTDLLGRFNLYEQYAAASYCSVNNGNSTGSKIRCTAGNCPLVEQADTQSVMEFQHSLNTDVTGFVAVDNTNKLVVISFRGTDSDQNIITDTNLTRVNADLCPNCLVHQGFWESWIEARDNITASLNDTKKSNPTYEVIVTGHSLGGAIATLCAAEIRKGGMKASLYTFGSPRLGDTHLSTFITAQGSNYRLTHANDIVPNLPPLVFPNLDVHTGFAGFAYVHISPEYHIKTGNDVVVTVKDIDELSGEVNFGGNTGTLLPSIGAHKWYFGNITAC
ncbi:alpha/beta-hydrolase [Microthyrium microscopicum]|uniref:Alpha/beta-hydrolase n=1 Tax=Microthyrium microscopicum TaxID=703497 RepID=A0A6A6U5W1_9PEZI|nr:alpha/beta-hydrolase [Microthyrium microscopicum]